jgi:hypothetical protein
MLMKHNIWPKRLILRQCFRVAFPSCSYLVEQMLPTTITKTMELHVLPHLKLAIIPY